MDMERLINPMIDQLLSRIRLPIQDWLATHPLWNWLLTHPLWLLGTIILLLFLLAGLLGAIASLTEKIWLFVLQAPIRLMQLIFIGTLKLLKIPFLPRANSQKSTQSRPERLTVILDRLEALKQEQDALIQEVRSIVANQNFSKPLGQAKPGLLAAQETKVKEKSLDAIEPVSEG